MPLAKCLQVEDFVVLGRPAGILGLGHLPPLLVGQVRPDEANLDKRLERLHLGPPQIVSGNDFHCDFVLAGSRMRVEVDLNRYLAGISLMRGRRV